MIYKVLYQENRDEAPHREATKALYIEAKSVIEARDYISKNKPYRVEFVQELSDAHLEYEKDNNPDFEVVKA